MKTNIKKVLPGIAAVIIIAAGVTAIYQCQKNSERTDLARRIADLGRGGPPQTIEGLKTAIAAYEDQIERYVQDAAKVGVYWKILASRLQDRGMHTEALEALERAVYWTPEDPSLHYMTGVSAGIVAKSFHDYTGQEGAERERLFALSEEGYLRAIELDDRYLRPRYGVGVLYVFELGRPAEAIPHLRKYLEISKNDVDAMFVLAAAYYMVEDYRGALDLYDRIISLTKDAVKKREAEKNKTEVMKRLYG